MYTFYIGQNDFTSNLAAAGIGGVQQYLPQVAAQIAWSIKVSALCFCDINHAPVRPNQLIEKTGPIAAR